MKRVVRIPCASCDRSVPIEIDEGEEVPERILCGCTDGNFWARVAAFKQAKARKAHADEERRRRKNRMARKSRKRNRVSH